MGTLTPAQVTENCGSRLPGSTHKQVAVVGLGYTGLPLACSFAAEGADVIGIDTDKEKVRQLAAGRSYLVDVPDAQVAAVAGHLSPTDDLERLGAADAIVICVPTPLSGDGEPDLSAVWDTVHAVGRWVSGGALVILQSTVPAGTTQVVASRLAELSGLVVGESLHVAYSPERIDPGNRAGWTLGNTPRLVGGVSAACTDRAAALMGQVCEKVIPVASSTVAEMAKLLENSFRLVNIGLVNELAALCDRLAVPVRQVVDAAATKPFAFMPHYATAGVGGECIPVDPLFLVHGAKAAGVSAGVISAAAGAAARRPIEVADAAHRWATDAREPERPIRALVAGLTYKPNVPDLRNTPAEPIVRRLRALGCAVSYSDPHIPWFAVDGEPVPAVEWREGVIESFDVVILATPHDELLDAPVWREAGRVLDAAGAMPPSPHVRHV